MEKLKFLVPLGAIFLFCYMIVFPSPATSADEYAKFGMYPRESVKWTKQVPGYDPHVNFTVEWPVGALVGGNADNKTPFLVNVGEKAVLSQAALPLKMVNWANGIAKMANEFDDITPLGVCRARSGKLKGKWGQLDPRTGIAGLSDATCYIPGYDGAYKMWIDDTTDFDVFIVPAVQAQWINHNSYEKLPHKLKRRKFYGDVTVCRGAYTGLNNLMKNWVNSKVSKLIRKYNNPDTELLLGVVIKGKCIVAEKGAIVGERQPQWLDKYEVLVVQADRATYEERGNTYSLRDTVPVAIRHRQSGLCLGADKNTMLVDCVKPHKGRALAPFFLTKDRRIKVGTSKDGVMKIGKKCLAGGFNIIGMPVTVTTCSDNPAFKWFLNDDGQLGGSFGTCMRAAKAQQKVGGGVEVYHDCLSSGSSELQWDAVRFGGFGVTQESGEVPLNIDITGYGTKKCFRGMKDKCLQLYPRGTKVSVRVKNTESTKFTKWNSGPCKNSTKATCSFTVGMGGDLAFAAKSTTGWEDELPFMLKVKASGKCLDKTRSKKGGAQIISWSCGKQNQNQRFQLREVKSPIKGDKSAVRMIRSAHSGLCLDVSGASKKDGAKIIQWKCDPKKHNQLWRVLWLKDNWFHLQSLHSNRCIDLAEGNKKDGAKFIQYKCTKNNDNQKFSVDG